MGTSFRQGSAKIYEFPSRTAVPAGQRSALGKPGTMRVQPFVEVACGSGWYHESAVQEAADRTRKE